MSNDNSKLDIILNLINQIGLNGLIIYSNGANTTAHPHFQYISGFKPMGANNAVIISKNGDVTLLVEPQWDSIRAYDKSWIANIIGTSNFQEDLVDIIRKFNISGSVGIIGSREMTEETYTNIEKVLDLRIADGIVGEIAHVKTDTDLDNIRFTAKIADIGFRIFLEHIRTGIREYELTAQIESAMRSAGAEDTFVLMSSGSHSYALHAPTDRRLADGDIIMAEITPSRDGQAIQLCRTAVLGNPVLPLVEKYNLLVLAFEESLKRIKVGAPASVISQTINKLLSEEGYGEYCYPPYMRSRGHGCGIGSIVGPVDLGQIDDKNEVKLQKQQVIVVHPNQYFPETGYLACGETIMVEEEGVERLAETETKLYIIEA